MATGKLHFDADVLGDVERESGLAHRRAAGHDDHVARLQTGGHLVQIVETGRHAGDVGGIFPVVKLLDAVDDIAQQRRDGPEALHRFGAGLGDLEHPLLGLVEQLLGVATGGVEGAGGDIVADGDQLSEHGPLVDDFGIAANIGRRRRGVGDFAQIGHAARLLDLVALFDGLVDRHHVGRLAHRDQFADVGEDAPVVVAVEIALGDDIGDAVPGRVVEQQAADQRLLGLDRMRRQLERRHLRVGNLVGVGQAGLGHGSVSSGWKSLPAEWLSGDRTTCGTSVDNMWVNCQQ